MIDEPLTDAERTIILALLMHACPRDAQHPMVTNIIAKVSGTDTVLVARRAYPAHTHASKTLLD